MPETYSKTYRIIIADDDPAARELMLGLLEECLPGANVVTVSDGTDLVERMRDAKYDLVLTDNQMPGLTGRNAIQTARNMGYLTPMFLVSSDTELPQIAHDAGANGYISKGAGLKTEIEQITAKYFK